MIEAIILAVTSTNSICLYKSLVVDCIISFHSTAWYQDSMTISNVLDTASGDMVNKPALVPLHVGGNL